MWYLIFFLGFYHGVFDSPDTRLIMKRWILHDTTSPHRFNRAMQTCAKTHAFGVVQEDEEGLSVFVLEKYSNSSVFLTSSLTTQQDFQASVSAFFDWYQVTFEQEVYVKDEYTLREVNDV